MFSFSPPVSPISRLLTSLLLLRNDDKRAVRTAMTLQGGECNGPGTVRPVVGPCGRSADTAGVPGTSGRASVPRLADGDRLGRARSTQKCRPRQRLTTSVRCAWPCARWALVRRRAGAQLERLRRRHTALLGTMPGKGAHAGLDAPRLCAPARPTAPRLPVRPPPLPATTVRLPWTHVDKPHMRPVGARTLRERAPRCVWPSISLGRGLGTHWRRW